MTLASAWELFEKAVDFEEKALDETKTEGLRKTALRATEKRLDEAVAEEAASLAAGERHAA